MADDAERTREWDRRQWASEVEDGSRADEPRWNKAEWVGEDRRGRRTRPQPTTSMPEGEPGISGNRHNPGVQDWASKAAEDANVADDTEGEGRRP